jgi:hypothetical protein
MKWNSAYINNGSIHLRLIKKSDANKNYPDYVQHTILEPKGNGIAELKGIVGQVSKEVYALAFEEAKLHGFTEVHVFRVKNDELIRKVFKL